MSFTRLSDSVGSLTVLPNISTALPNPVGYLTANGVTDQIDNFGFFSGLEHQLK